MAPLWPPGFERIPSEPWAKAPVDPFAEGYDGVGRHGWYANLDPTVAELAAALREGGILVDYSGGTGLLEDRLLPALGWRQVGVLVVDSSPKFLRLAAEKFRADARVAFRLLPFLPEERRLRRVDEVVGLDLLRRGADAVVSANAIHLYSDLEATLASWVRILRPGGLVHVQSGNIGAPSQGRWIIDETVERLQETAMAIVRSEPRYAAYRAVLDDPAAMAAHTALRHRYFLPVRPLDHYLRALRKAGLAVERFERRPVPVEVEEWADFLSVYHDGVLGWLGGTERVEGRDPSPQAVAHRREVLREALRRLIGGPRFTAEWTYVTARREASPTPSP
ncbi:MAG TPA: class I SAM-dependent methyltransferase [Candidatus Thermoplasmatota archaeon]|nr:class I SAM-dependent methyltransferase [Candidatus Thermoplasmatota archaeon]